MAPASKGALLNKHYYYYYYIDMHVAICMQPYVCMCIYVCMYMYAYMLMCVMLHASMSNSKCVYVCVMCMYAHVVCVYMCMYIWYYMVIYILHSTTHLSIIRVCKCT